MTAAVAMRMCAVRRWRSVTAQHMERGGGSLHEVEECSSRAVPGAQQVRAVLEPVHGVSTSFHSTCDELAQPSARHDFSTSTASASVTRSLAKGPSSQMRLICAPR